MASVKAHTSALDDIRPLLLAGGLSTRMGTPKHLLPWIDGKPSYQHTLEALRRACPGARTLYVSLRNEEQYRSFSVDNAVSVTADIQPIYDSAGDGAFKGCGSVNGPAAGLLAAHAFSPKTTWLAVGCDYPLLTASALEQLIREYVPPVTCFTNAEGFTEPLLAIWSPAALDTLQRNVMEGRSGPCATIKKSKGKVIRPTDEVWIFGANTKEEWDSAKLMAERQRTNK